VALTNGYWQSRYWTSYWQDQYWQDYGSAIGSLLPPGYWQSRFWTIGYFFEDFWHEYGSAVGNLLSPGYWQSRYWARCYFFDDFWHEYGVGKMATANDIINAAFRKIGLSNPSSSDADNALSSLNELRGAWGLEFLINSVTSESFNLIVGQSVYTIGSGGDFNTVRPIKIDSFYIRDSNGYDRIMTEISPDDFDRIKYKSFSAKPYWFYYLPEYPLGKIILNKEPDLVYTAYFKFVKNFTEFADITDTVDLPNEYKEALIYNLAIAEAENRDVQISQSAYVRAAETKDLISRRNAAAALPRLADSGFGKGRYNIFTDENE